MNRSSLRILRTITLTVVIVGLIVLALGGFLTPLFRYTLNPIVAVQAWISTRFIALYEFVTVPRDVASLRQQNTEQLDEISRLQTQVIELQQKVSESSVLYALLDFARARPENEYVAAAVVGKDPNPFMRYVLLDRGSDDGIRHGMSVVTQDGLVGRVDAVTAGACRVQLITDPASVVNIHLQSSQVEAVLEGSLTGELSLQMLPREQTIPVGDIILTSGLGGNYPSSIFIGQVLAVRKHENELFQTASVQTGVNFSGLKAVLIITNFKPINITPLLPTPIP